jgi:hypothetical protein
MWCAVSNDNGVDIATARGTSMQTFTIGIGHRWWAQVFRRNPLVRHSDRIEALVRGFAVVVVVVAIPVALAIGTSVHDGRTRVYAEESRSRHQVTATAVERGEVVVEYRGVSFMARATWSASGRAIRTSSAGRVPLKSVIGKRFG